MRFGGGVCRAVVFGAFGPGRDAGVVGVDDGATVGVAPGSIGCGGCVGFGTLRGACLSGAFPSRLRVTGDCAVCDRKKMVVAACTVENPPQARRVAVGDENLPEGVVRDEPYQLLDAPGIQLYTANFLGDEPGGKGGREQSSRIRTDSESVQWCPEPLIRSYPSPRGQACPECSVPKEPQEVLLPAGGSDTRAYPHENGRRDPSFRD